MDSSFTRLTKLGSRVARKKVGLGEMAPNLPCHTLCNWVHPNRANRTTCGNLHILAACLSLCHFNMAGCSNKHAVPATAAAVATAKDTCKMTFATCTLMEAIFPICPMPQGRAAVLNGSGPPPSSLVLAMLHVSHGGCNMANATLPSRTHLYQNTPAPPHASCSTP